MNAAPFPFYAEMTVRFRDLDAMGHVNNAVFFTYMENARNAFFRSVFDIGSLKDIPVIVGEAVCRYLSPAYFNETIRVGIGVGRWGRKSFDFVYCFQGGDGRLVASGRTAMVMYDYEKGATYPIPESFRQRIVALQGDWEPPV